MYVLLSSPDKQYLALLLELTSERPLTRRGIGHQGKEAVVFCLNFYGRVRCVVAL